MAGDTSGREDTYQIHLGDEDGQGPRVELDYTLDEEIRIESGENDLYICLSLDEFDRIARFISVIRSGAFDDE